VIKYVFVVCEFVVSGSHARRGVVVVVNIDNKQTWKLKLQDKNPKQHLRCVCVCEGVGDALLSFPRKKTRLFLPVHPSVTRPFRVIHSFIHP